MTGLDGELAHERAIVFCGFMGVGKTSIGRRVAQALRREFVDADDVIVERVGYSIAKMFEIGEEARFRSLEAEVVAEMVRRRPPVVLALGGGALGNEQTRQLLLDEALLVHLDQPFEELASSLSSLRRGRPVIAKASDEEVRALYEARRSLYAIAPLQVLVHRRGIARAAEQVLSAIGDQAGHQ